MDICDAGRCVREARPTARCLYCLANAAQTIESTDERFVEPELHRIRGELLNGAGDTVAAEQNYHLALAEAQKQSSKLYELRAATNLARLWRDQGKRAEARDLLVLMYGWFTEGFDTPVLKEAKTFLDQTQQQMRMARIWRDQGKREEAREVLAPVYGWFTEGFDTRDLKEAKALVDELAS